jgi:hypothetical protein
MGRIWTFEVLENRVLRKVFGPTLEEGKQSLRKLCSEELQELCSSPNILMAKKLRRKEMDGKYGTQGISEKCIQFCLEGLKERDFLEDLRVDGMLILNWILKEIVGRMWTEIVGRMWTKIVGRMWTEII